MKDLQVLLGRISKSNLEFLLQLYGSAGNETKKIKLIHYLLENQKDAKDKEAIIYVYGDCVKGNRYNQLKHRVRNDLILLLLYENPQKNYTNKYFKNRYEVRKLVLVIDILLQNGDKNLAKKYISRAMKICEVYELPYEGLIVAETLQRHYGQLGGRVLYLEYAKKINYYLKLIAIRNNSYNVYYEAMLPNVFSAEKGSNNKLLIDSINKLLYNYKKSGLSEVKSLHLRLSIYYYHLIEDFNKAYQYALDFSSLIENSLVLNAASNQAGGKMQLAILAVYLRRKDEGVAYIDEAIQLFGERSANLLRALNVKFILYLIGNDFSGMEEVLKLSRNNANIKNDYQHKVIFTVRRITLEFCRGKFEECIYLINKYSGLIKDKRGWQIGIKILEIMCIVELKNIDWYDYRIKSLQRIIQREKLLKNERLNAICSFLIENKVLLFQRSIPKNIDSISQSRIMSSGLPAWDPLSFELLDFADWARRRFQLN